MGAIPNEGMDYMLLYYIKHKNDIHAPAALQKLYRLFGVELSKLRFRGHNLFNEFSK